MNGPASAVITSPAMPLPPMPSTTTFSIASRSGNPVTPSAAFTASATCSGKASVTSHIPSVSRRASVTSAIERRLDALRGGLGDEPLVLRVVDRLGLVDEHDRDVVADRVPALEARVVQRVLRLEVEERALVLRAREDLEQLNVQGHAVTFPWRRAPRPRDAPHRRAWVPRG